MNIATILCYAGIHQGEWSRGWERKTWSTTPKGVCDVTTWFKQERYCTECNQYEFREVKVGECTYQPWHAGYAEQMRKLKEGV